MEIPEQGALPPLPDRNRPADAPIRQPSIPNGEPETTAQRDTVRLTNKGRELKSAIDVVRLLPEIREDRVMRIKRRVEAGTYRVKGDWVAVNMIDEALENNKALEEADIWTETQPKGRPHAYDDQESAYHLERRGGWLPGNESDPG